MKRNTLEVKHTPQSTNHFNTKTAQKSFEIQCHLMDLDKHKSLESLTFRERILKIAKLSASIYISQKTSPQWTWTRGRAKVTHSCAVSSPHFGRARLPVSDGFPGMGEAHRDDPQLEGLDSSSSLLSLHCTGLSRVYLILTKCSEVPAGYKYSINVSYPDDLRERASGD